MAEQKTLHQKLSELSENLWWSWQPGVDGLRSFLALIQRELQGLGSPR